MREKPEFLQDPDTTSEFGAEYSSLLSSQITANQFMEFYEYAHTKAAKCVLAACVFEYTREVIDVYKNVDATGLPRRRRALLKSAGNTALQVVGLDVFLRDETNQRDLVLYTTTGDGSPHESAKYLPGLHLTVADGSWLRHYGIEGRQGIRDGYYLEPNIQFGVPSRNTSFGKTESWLQGTSNYDFAGNNDQVEWPGRFCSSFIYPYHQLLEPTAWPGYGLLPRITMGTGAVIEEYEKMLHNDLTHGYTENKYRRPSYLLFREACHLGAPIVEGLHALAADKLILREWCDQMVKDEAVYILTELEYVRKKGIDFEEYLPRLGLEEEELEWLGVTKASVHDAALNIAPVLGLEATRRDIEEISSWIYRSERNQKK